MTQATRKVRTILGLMVLAATWIHAAELSPQDRADVAALTKFIEGPLAPTGMSDDDFEGLFARRAPELKRIEPYDSGDANPWLKTTGMCDPTILFSAFHIFSLLRDEIEQKHEDRLYRAWLVVISRYRLFCDELKKEAAEGETDAGIAVIEEMIQQEKAGTLKARAAAIEARLSAAKNDTPVANSQK